MSCTFPKPPSKPRRSSGHEFGDTASGGNLKPTVAWLEDVGLGRAQVAKVVAGFPNVLGLSIEGNLKATVAWLEDVGLGRAQVAKVIGVFRRCVAVAFRTT